MVLQTCRGILQNLRDAEDAFQATFLILARRGGSLWVRDSIGPWLHRLACRASVLRASRASARWGSCERAAPERKLPVMVEANGDDPSRLVHDEINRLPARYRVPLVLCELEGHTYEEAARHVGCPVGTIKSRLARGRNRLHDRLERRGANHGDAVLGLALVDSGSLALPRGLATSTVHAAIVVARIGPAAGIELISPTAANIASGLRGSMTLARLSLVTVALITVATMLTGLAIGRGMPTQEPPADRPSTSPLAQGPPTATLSEQSRPTRAWQRTDTYEPPNFERFFPDDPAAGVLLDQLMTTYEKDPRPDVEKLGLVRQGFRRAKTNRASMLRAVGTYIWGKSPQDPDAIEIMYHAADYKGKGPNPNDSLLHAIHNGLSVVHPKSPAILQLLVDICMNSDDTTFTATYASRIAWGSADQRSEIIDHLKPYYRSPDKAIRQRALEVRKVLSGQLDAHLWWTNHLRNSARGPSSPTVCQRSNEPFKSAPPPRASRPSN